jgi:hypothetical protein
VTFQNKVYDNKGDYSNSTGVFTAPKSGLYLVECSIVYGAAEPAVSHYLTIYKAGSSRELAAYAVSPPGGGDLQLSVSGTIYLNAGEYIAAYTIHGSSVDKSINADSALSRFKVLQIA